MPVYKDKNGTWYVMTRCDDWQGQRKQKCKRGFKTKREAQDWERRFLLQQGGDLDMLFKDFYKLYEQDMKARLKQNTWEHKACVIKSKIYFLFFYSGCTRMTVSRSSLRRWTGS